MLNTVTAIDASDDKMKFEAQSKVTQRVLKDAGGRSRAGEAAVEKVGVEVKPRKPRAADFLLWPKGFRTRRNWWI